MARCQFKTGLLSLRECGELTGSRCAGCGRAVCTIHVRYLPADRGGGVACPDCLATGVDPRRSDTTGAASASASSPSSTSGAATHAAGAVVPAAITAAAVVGVAAAQNPTDDAVARLRRRHYGDGYGSTSDYGSSWHDHDYGSFDSGGGGASGSSVEPRDFQDS